MRFEGFLLILNEYEISCFFIEENKYYNNCFKQGVGMVNLSVVFDLIIKNNGLMNLQINFTKTILSVLNT